MKRPRKPVAVPVYLCEGLAANLWATSTGHHMLARSLKMEGGSVPVRMGAPYQKWKVAKLRHYLSEHYPGGRIADPRTYDLAADRAEVYARDLLGYTLVTRRPEFHPLWVALSRSADTLSLDAESAHGPIARELILAAVQRLWPWELDVEVDWLWATPEPTA